MTISNTPRKAGPYAGNGSATTFAFAYKVFSAADVLVVRADTATGIETTLTLTTDYTVSLNADQDTSPGGTITTTTAPAAGQTITLSSDMDYTQPVELTNNGGFYPRVINDALDRLTIGQQQLKELTDRTLKVAVSTPSGVDTTLPAPSANKLIGWNPTADNLQNMDPTTLATIVAFGTANADIFSGDGVTTQFTMSANPGALNNLDVSIGGATKTPGVDYTWTSGTTITFTSAPPSGTGNVLVRYLQGLPQGYADWTSITGKPFIEAATYGATAGGVASVNAAGIQSAIDYAASLGGGFVRLTAGTYDISDTLVMKNKVILIGEGSATTEIRLANNTNKTMVKSYNYDSLVGSDTWLVASGNLHAYGLMRLRLNGNKANQTAGSGVQFYGKRLHIDDVMIVQCKEEGWHSESNQTIPGTPATNGDDFPEGLIRGLYVWQCDSHGFVFRGQHDTYIESLFVGVCGGWGVRFESDTSAPGVYSGTCDSGFMHVYANVAGGVYISQYASHQSAFMISENNDGVGLQVDGWQVKIGQLQLYSNCRVTGTYQAVIAGSECKLPSVHLKDTGHSKSGIQITGAKNTIDVTAIGAGSTGCAVDVNNTYNHVRATIDNWSGTGGIGLRTGNTTQLQHGKIIATINACSTCWNNASAGTYNDYTISGFAAAGKSFFSGSAPNTSKTENWNVKGVTNGVTSVLSENRIRSLNAIDLNSTTEQEITVAHGLVTTPLIQDVVPTIAYLNSNLTWVQSRLYVRSVDATNVKVRFKASVAAGGADVADLIVNVKL